MPWAMPDLGVADCSGDPPEPLVRRDQIRRINAVR